MEIVLQPDKFKMFIVIHVSKYMTTCVARGSNQMSRSF